MQHTVAKPISKPRLPFGTVQPVCALLILLLVGDAHAQTDAGDSNAAHARYNEATREAINRNRQLTEQINAEHRAELKAYSLENSRRAQAVSNALMDATRDLRNSGVTGEERNKRHQRIMAEDKRRRADYAKWRSDEAAAIADKYDKLHEDRRVAHDASMAAILATRNATLVALKASSGGQLVPIDITPGAEDAPPDQETDEQEAAGETAREPGQLRHVIARSFSMVGNTAAEVREWGTLTYRLPVTFMITGQGDTAVQTYEPLRFRLPTSLRMEGTSE